MAIVQLFKFRTLIKGLSCIVIAGIAFGAFAQSTDKIKSDLQKQLGDGAKVQSVIPSPITGLYEVVVNNSIVYTDPQGKYLIQGEILEIKSGNNLTQSREAEINKINWSEFPLQNAVKVVRGNGARKMVVFADPNCGYCKKLEKTFTEMNNVTIYTFLMPILSADSTTKSKQIWCAADPAKSWVDWMVNGVSPSGKQDCSNPLDKNLALGKSLNISGTPAIFFTDGSRIPGAAGKEMIEKKLASSSK
jgi:thiol:disulfide interchange protein DsbC